MFIPDVTVDLPFILGTILLVGVIIYAVTGGADFGGGIWDLLARGPRTQEQKKEIARAIGPIWEANHVWLIFVIVLTFSCFPPVFAAISSALYVPLSLVLVGIVLRGAAFVFRAYAADVIPAQRAWGNTFAVASAATPALLGMCAGAVASGDIRIVDGKVTSSYFTTWLAPFPIAIGLLALISCAYLAAVYLCVETEGELQDNFRIRALVSGVAFAVIGTISLPLMWKGAPEVWDGMWQRDAWVMVPVAIVTGFATMYAVWTRRFQIARVTAVIEVAVLLIGWALAQYPYLIVSDLTFSNAAASDAMLKVALITYGIGAVVLVPSLVLLFMIFKGEDPAVTGDYGAGTSELHQRHEHG